MSDDVAIDGREKLVRMANQIAGFFDSADPDHAAADIARHINDFWEPRMRQHFLALAADGGDGLKPSVKSAVPLIRRPV